MPADARALLKALRKVVWTGDQVVPWLKTKGVLWLSMGAAERIIAEHFATPTIPPGYFSDDEVAKSMASALRLRRMQIRSLIEALPARDFEGRRWVEVTHALATCGPTAPMPDERATPALAGDLFALVDDALTDLLVRGREGSAICNGVWESGARDAHKAIRAALARRAPIAPPEGKEDR